MTSRINRVLKIARRHGPAGVMGMLCAKFGRQPGESDYAAWVARQDALAASAQERRGADAHVQPCQPLISIVMPVCNAPARVLEQALESVHAQSYQNWQLCIADDASDEPHVREILQRFTAGEQRAIVRFRPTRGHISMASNTALEMAAGAWVTFLDHDDMLAPHALCALVEAIGRHPAARLIFSDEDKLDAAGRRTEPHFKTGWNAELLRAQNTISHLCAYPTAVVRGVGGFRLGFEGAQDYDLALRVIEVAGPDGVVHIPQVLYHWRMSEQSTAQSADAKSYVKAAALQALREHLDRKGIAAQVGLAGVSTYHRVHYELPQPPSTVTIMRFGAGAHANPGGLRRATEYANCEIVDTVRDDPAAINAAARAASGELVCLLAAGLVPLERDWLAEMAGHATQPGVGAVGAKLLRRDGCVAHAGYVMAEDGTIAHPFAGLMEDDPGPFGRAGLAQDAGAVSLACLLIRRRLFLEVGGLDEQRPIGAPSAIDLCMRLKAAGHVTRWTPFAVLRWRGARHAMGIEDALTADADLARRWQAYYEPCAFAGRGLPLQNSSSLK